MYQMTDIILSEVVRLHPELLVVLPQLVLKHPEVVLGHHLLNRQTVLPVYDVVA